MILICSRNGKWVLNQLAPPFPIEVKSTGVWRGKWEWFSTQRWQKKGGGRAGFRVYAGAEQNQEGGKCAYPDTLTAFYLEIERPYANAFPCLASKLWKSDRWKEEKETWRAIFFLKKNPKACIDSKLSHPRQDVVSDRPVHTSWALFVPGMWSPSNQSQQLSQCNGEEEDRWESGRGGSCINIASSISPTPPSSCSMHLHTKGAPMACAPRFWSASITDERTVIVW